MIDGEDLIFDVGELVTVFGEPMPWSNEELLDYWFRYERPDGASVLLNLSGYERSVAIVVRCAGGAPASSIRVERCGGVRVLESARRTLEVVGDSPPIRCVLALDAESVLEISVPA